MELTEAREILEDIGLADAITPDFVVATEIVLARIDELENVVSAYRVGSADAFKATTPQTAPAPHIPVPEGFEEDCGCLICEQYRNTRGPLTMSGPTLLSEIPQAWYPAGLGNPSPTTTYDEALRYTRVSTEPTRPWEFPTHILNEQEDRTI